MSELSERIYIKQDVTREWLQSQGFKYNRILSTSEMDVYTYRFPVYKYGDTCTLECEISVILQNGNVNINVYDYNTRNKYAPFYCIKYGDYNNIIRQINEKIQKELNKLKIEKEENYGNKNKKTKRKRSNTNKRKQGSSRQ